MKLIIGLILSASLLSHVIEASVEKLFGDGQRLIDIAPVSFHVAAYSAIDYRILSELLGNGTGPANSVDKIEQVIDQVMSLRENWPKKLPKTIPLLHRRDPFPTKSALLLASLPEMIHQCDWPAYQTMLSNYLAALDDKIVLRPSDTLKSAVLAAIRLHYEKCRSNYYTTFETLYDSLDASLRDKIDELLDPELVDRILFSPDSLAKTISSKVYHANGLILDKIIQLTEASEDRIFIKAVPAAKRRWLVPDEFVGKTLENHLIAPCRDYEQHFGQLFYPIIFDLSLQSDSIRMINPNNDARFTGTLKKFSICSVISERSGMIAQRIVTSLIERSKHQAN